MTRSSRLLVIFCCSIAALIGVPRLSFAHRSLGDRAASDIAGISTALQWYKVDTGDYPTQAQGLAALCTKPEGIDSSVWGGPYYGKWVPKDPWGNDYVYVIPGKNNKLSFDLYSLGEDAQSATGGNDPDDVNSWDPESGSYYPLIDPIRTVIRYVTLLVVATVIVLRLVLGLVRRYCKRKGILTKESS